MELFDNLKKTAQTVIDAASAAANDAGQSIQDFAGSIAEQQAQTRAKRDEIKRLAAEEASGFYTRNGLVVVSTMDGMKAWLNNLAADTTPALMQTLQTQLQMLKFVQSPSMTGMALDNMIVCLDKAIKTSKDPVEIANIREAVASMIQNYFFMQEANLRCAQLENKEEAGRLLSQAGDMLSDAVSKTAVALAGDSAILKNTVVHNVFESPEAQKGYVKNVLSWIRDKKILNNKEIEYYKTLEMLFESMDTHAKLLGPSILIRGMLVRYRQTLVDRYIRIKIQQYNERGNKIDVKKIEALSSGLTSTASALISPIKKGAITGAVQSFTALGGLIADFVNNSKKGLDVEAYCNLQNALDKECERLKEEHTNLEQELENLKAQYEEIGFLKFSQKKEFQEKIDRKKAEADDVYARLMITRDQASIMKQTFPDSFAIKSDIDAYKANLVRIEQKFVV